MAQYLAVSDMVARAANEQPLGAEAFDLIRAVAHRVDPSSSETDPALLDVIIRLLERREELNGSGVLLDAVVRQVGLFPYLEPQNLSTSDQVAFEAHRPVDLTDTVFHRIQSDIYRRLLTGENIVLSAPTSFGKSLIVDALISSRRYETIVVIVPTIALIDETRRRMSKFSAQYKVVTHPSQRPGERTIYVMTQERLLDLPEIPPVDLFVIDEFYKLDPRQDADRAGLLNQAFRRLWRTGAQFFLLGPNVDSLSAALPAAFEATFIRTDFRTVAADVRRVSATRAETQTRLLEVCASLEGPTLVFCRSPNRVRQVGEWLSETTDLIDDPQIAAACAWLGDNYHPEWHVIAALRRGIGLHHGRLPRSLAQWMVRAFNDGRLRYLVCTSTLIEGVNTRAKNVVILDKQIAQRTYDYFTFNNIRGRSGRMFYHFVGTIVLFHEPPEPTLPIVDIPVLSQSEDASDSLLIQLDQAELTERSKDRLAPFYAQDNLSVSTLRENVGVDPTRQIAVAELLLSDRTLAQNMAWSGFPRYEQLVTTSELIVQTLRGQSGMVSGVASGRQLAYLISRLSQAGGDIKRLIGDMNEQGSDAVEATLEFVRYWPGHNFPRYLMALDRIQREVLPRMGMAPGNYSFYASSVENLFNEPPLLALEEYGVPIQVSRRLAGVLRPDGDVDATLERLAGLALGDLVLAPFERELLADAIEHL